MEEEKGFYSHGAVNKSFMRLTQQYLNELKKKVLNKFLIYFLFFYFLRLDSADELKKIN